jgi:hypothetical protein
VKLKDGLEQGKRKKNSLTFPVISLADAIAYYVAIPKSYFFGTYCH